MLEKYQTRSQGDLHRLPARHAYIDQASSVGNPFLREAEGYQHRQLTKPATGSET